MSRWRGRCPSLALEEVLDVGERKPWSDPRPGLPARRLFEDAAVTENKRVTKEIPVTGAENPATILVTAEVAAVHLAQPKKRGRPKSSAALSPAEKQRAYRERKKAK